MWPLFSIFFLICLKNKVEAILWNSNNYPNPVIDYQKCGMNFSAQICDPDSAFSSNDRLVIENKLKWLQAATSKNDSSGYSRKGLFAMTVVGNYFQGRSSKSLKSIANDMLSKWNSDSYCKKLIIIAFAVKDREVWITGDSDTSIGCEKYTEIFQDQKSLFQYGDYTSAILNIIDALKAASEASQQSMSAIAIIGIVAGIIAAVIGLICCCKYLCKGPVSNTSRGGKYYNNGGAVVGSNGCYDQGYYDGGSGDCGGGGGGDSGGGDCGGGGSDF